MHEHRTDSQVRIPFLLALAVTAVTVIAWATSELAMSLSTVAW